MKYLAPTKGGILRRIHIDALVEIKAKLEQAKKSRDWLDIWAESLGYSVVSVQLIPPSAAIIRGKKIYITKGLTEEELQYAIAHEHFHSQFHTNITAYKYLGVWWVNRRERQANYFAEQVAGSAVSLID